MCFGGGARLPLKDPREEGEEEEEEEGEELEELPERVGLLLLLPRPQLRIDFESTTTLAPKSLSISTVISI